MIRLARTIEFIINFELTAISARCPLRRKTPFLPPVNRKSRANGCSAISFPGRNQINEDEAGSEGRYKRRYPRRTHHPQSYSFATLAHRHFRQMIHMSRFIRAFCNITSNPKSLFHSRFYWSHALFSVPPFPWSFWPIKSIVQ